jgi:hypothetical protein
VRSGERGAEERIQQTGRVAANAMVTVACLQRRRIDHNHAMFLTVPCA